MSAVTPGWYDVLDVDASADEAAIRAAWKSAIADLDPTDRRFRVYNRAAEVLLDPGSRAAYDAELAAERPDPEPIDPEPGAQPAAPGAAPARRPVPTRLLVALCVLTLACLAGSLALWQTRETSDADVEAATGAARAAAETAVVPVLSYDAADLETSRAAAVSYLTPGYRKEYEQFFGGVMAENAPRTGTVVEASVVRSGVVRSGADRAEVLVVVDQSTTNRSTKEPTVIKYWVTVEMERRDGRWLVGGMKTRA